jgi:hypothetical protein
MPPDNSSHPITIQYLDDPRPFMRACHIDPTAMFVKNRQQMIDRVFAPTPTFAQSH